ncbi:hypothetical protein NHX12_005403 [Muraenolepis orangiensis]|uniref:HMG box domain-containing protein n=1 Tax=Muraenolepis orangiensis TaxID=630683 RepID=A0A9Q0IDN7_9TELE|nr:hypothetical protein NHX12_005403 [Muraenolepis orangiensis]
MDVRFYPTAGGNSIPGDPQNLDFAHCLGYYNFNKFQNNNYMNMTDANGALLAAGDTFHTPSLGDEEFEIPPITPPPEMEPDLGSSEVHSPYQEVQEPAAHHRVPLTPQFPPQSLELPSITISRNMMDQDAIAINNSLPVNVGPSHLRQYPSNPALMMRSLIDTPNGMMPRGHLTTINQSHLNAQLGVNMSGSNHITSPSPPASKSATPSPSSSTNEDEQDDGNRVIGEKRPAPKPVSAYALFFRDTQAAIKSQNPNATFGEVSKIVASMWDGLGEEQKQVYKSKTEAAKKEYLKALAAYRASLVSKAAAESAEAQTIRSVQQTLASTNLSPGMVLPSPLNQHSPMPSPGLALQQPIPRAIAPKPIQLRLGGQMGSSVAVGHQNAPSGLPPQMLGQMGAGGAQSGAMSQMSPPMAPGGQQHAIQQIQQQHQMQKHLQHHQMQQQQMHHQHIQQQMQHQHFQHHLQQQLQQHHMQEQQQQQQQQQQHQQQRQQQQQQQQHMQLQHMQMHQLHQQQIQHLQQQQKQQQQQQSQCSPPQHSPGTPHSASGSTSLGSPQPSGQHQQPHPSQIQAHAQAMSQVSIY